MNNFYILKKHDFWYIYIRNMQECSPKKSTKEKFSEKPLLSAQKLRMEATWTHRTGSQVNSYSLICSNQPAQTQLETFTSTFLPQLDFPFPSLNRYQVLGFYFLVGELFKGGEKYLATDECVSERTNCFCKTLGS